MSVALDESAPIASSASSDTLAPPAARGSLTIADRVVERVAAHAATEVDLATGAPRTLLGQRLPSAERARASARVDGGLVSVSVSLAVTWPSPVRRVAADVRAHLTRRVEELTGLEVAEVDVDVATLPAQRDDTRRVR